MVPRIQIAVVAGAALAVTACGGSGLDKALGLGKTSPDEYQVVQQPPLVVPPDFALRPPTPGAPRPQVGSTRDEARRLVTGDDSDAPGPRRTPGESALLQQAGADEADPEIRRVINAESVFLAQDDQRFVDELMFWQVEAPPGTIIDPVAEAQRLQRNAEAGLPVTEGETPIIKRRVKAPLEDLF